MATTMEDVAHFVLNPFQEIVDKGNEALGNAGDSQPMLKAAQSLVKEGERAIKKIEPLCKRYVAEYGVNFRNALRDNEEIGDYRGRLEDLLWEFEDFTGDPDSFDADKFIELQALSRKSAPKIYDILMRLKIEHPYNDLSPVGSIPSSFAHQASPGARHSQPFFPHVDQNHALQVGMDSPGEPRPDSGVYTVEDATSQLKRLMGEEDGFTDPPPPQRELPPPPPRQPPQIPDANPWDVNAPPVTDDVKRASDATLDRRPEVERDQSESPIDPRINPLPAAEAEAHSRQSTASVNWDKKSAHPPESIDFAARQSDDRSTLPSNSHYGTSPARDSLHHNQYPTSATRPRHVTANSHISSTIPEDAPVDGTGGLSLMTSQQPVTSPFGPPTASSGGFTTHSTFSGFEQARRPTIYSHGTQQSMSESQVSPRMRPVPNDFDGLEVSISHADHEAPIPVELDKEAHERSHSGSQPSLIDCSITPRSSFWMAKGLCEGAKEVSRGGIGVKKTKKPVGFTTSATVARCTSCMCELDFRDIENDVNKLDSGNYSRGAINYRVRFLQKSHLAAKRNDDVQYGCLFCLQLGHTMDESDATIFFSPKSLMDHIARHPRPLPDVSGLTVIEAAQVPSEFHNDYDIQLKKGPEPHPVIEARSEIHHLPTGTAKDGARRLYGQRLLFDRTPALELAAGARITGLTWPAKYNGEWAMGWHDGVYASVPTDLIKLDVPGDQHVKIGGTGNIRARAKWRYNPGKDKSSNWLKFEKNDMITDIGWSYFDHWCWSGTNPKGKWGIFPQAFIDSNTLEEPTGLSRAMSLSDEKNRSTSLMGKFGLRQSSVNPSSQYGSGGRRPVSVAGSTSSHESKGMHIPGRNYTDVHAS